MGALLLASACTGGDPTEAPRGVDLDQLPALPEVSAEQGHPRFELRPNRELILALVGEVRGEIEPCGCPTLPFGGFPRREKLLERLRKEGIPLFHLDAGELLLKGLATARTESRERRATLLMHLSRAVGVDLWTPGPTDLLALGEQGLRRLASGRLDAPPAVSATWLDAEGRTILAPARILERGGRRIGVVGLSALPSGEGRSLGIQGRDPVEAARAAIEAFPADLDLVVALSNLGDEEARRVSREVPGLALVLSTKGVSVDDPAASEGGALVVETPDRGRYLEVVRAQLGAPAGAPVVAWPEAWKWLERHTLREKAGRGEPVGEQLGKVEAEFLERSEGRNLAWATPVALADDLDGVANVDAALDAFKESTLKAAAVQAAPPAEAREGFASAGQCVNCHSSEFSRWALTDHARAWESLLLRRAAGDPECVGCHATGFGEPGGLGELTSAAVSRLKGVQCEECHGPMAGHPDDARVKARPVVQETCLSCHDPANSPNFDFGAYLRRATCQDMGPVAQPE